MNCSHVYVADYTQAPSTLGKRCPYSELCKTTRSTESRDFDTRSSLDLPLDEHGACIFHSHESAWKRENDFQQKFIQLVQLLNADEAAKHYDFSEFVFVGDKPKRTTHADHDVLQLDGVAFRKEAYFRGAQFLDALELESVVFEDGAEFRGATFDSDFRVSSTRFNGLDSSDVIFKQDATFTNVTFETYAYFQNSTFNGHVRFEDTRFLGIADFINAAFIPSDPHCSVRFSNVRLDGTTEFGKALFQCHVEFRDVCFASTVDFVDTSFDLVSSPARHRGAAVEFNRIDVTKDAVLNFTSTDARNKMFKHDVQFTFKEDPAGTIRFENVNYRNVSAHSRDQLKRLERAGRVEIGLGCMKYRLQTDVRTISISESNRHLVVELCQTFTNYFTVCNGCNLGFEIVERDNAKVSFFYFTDEDITEAVFIASLAQTERSLWNLLSIGSDEELSHIGDSKDTQLSKRKESQLVNAVDGISALLGTFFRVASRIAVGAWKEADTMSLLSAVRFNEGNAELAQAVHRIIVDKYQGKTLFSINRQQNERLPPNILFVANQTARSRLKILFLAANPDDQTRLKLDKEMIAVAEAIQSSKYGDKFVIVFKPAVRLKDLQKVLLEERPHIVHFSGHGSSLEELIFDDGSGKSQPITKTALVDMFDILKDNIRLVVLNACYSRPQAEGIVEVTDFAIGMNKAIGDKAAIEFAKSLYLGIGFGRTMTEAFRLGTNALLTYQIPEEDIPQLLSNKTSDPSEMALIGFTGSE